MITKSIFQNGTSRRVRATSVVHYVVTSISALLPLCAAISCVTALNISAAFLCARNIARLLSKWTLPTRELFHQRISRLQSNISPLEFRCVSFMSEMTLLGIILCRKMLSQLWFSISLALLWFVSNSPELSITFQYRSCQGFLRSSPSNYFLFVYILFLTSN